MFKSVVNRSEFAYTMFCADLNIHSIILQLVYTKKRFASWTCIYLFFIFYFEILRTQMYKCFL